MLFSLPTVSLLIKPPGTEKFSILYILGPNHNTASIPFTIKENVQYTIYLGIENQENSPTYYTCDVKVRNETIAAPSSQQPSTQPSLYQYKAMVDTGKTWEAPLTFEVNKITNAGQAIVLTNIRINDMPILVSERSMLNQQQTGYSYFLFMELSTFDSTVSQSHYDGRYVQLKLNVVP